MKKEIADQWLAALRSGQYTQGRGALRDCKDGQEAFCCLGVLCELAVLEGKAERFGNSYSDCKVFLPRSVAEWSGMSQIDGSLPETMAKPALFQLNDDKGWSFEQLAEHIEKHWRHL